MTRPQPLPPLPKAPTLKWAWHPAPHVGLTTIVLVPRPDLDPFAEALVEPSAPGRRTAEYQVFPGHLRRADIMPRTSNSRPTRNAATPAAISPPDNRCGSWRMMGEARRKQPKNIAPNALKRRFATQYHWVTWRRSDGGGGGNCRMQASRFSSSFARAAAAARRVDPQLRHVAGSLEAKATVTHSL